ncbi:MAG: hypothetical protein HY282_11810 [Nitrospirae bacterium]|nr:hypothetical protein [Candidatus Manganitrophaceae bacterium]
MKSERIERTVDPQMEVYSDIKRADYTKEAGVYDQKRFLHEAGRFYADLSNQIIFDLLDAPESRREAGPGALFSSGQCPASTV